MTRELISDPYWRAVADRAGGPGPAPDEMIFEGPMTEQEAAYEAAMLAQGCGPDCTHEPGCPGCEAYERYCEERERECGVGISTGGFDPYGTSCDLERGHAGPHEGPDWFGEGRLRWTGGGSCVGDPLPYSIIEHVREGR